LALVGPLFSGVTLALLLTQYNRRRRNSLVTAVEDLESRIAEQNAVIETQQNRIDDLESDIGELQGRNWGEYGSETQSSRSATPQTARSSRSGGRSRDSSGEPSRTAVGGGNASDSEDGAAEKGAERSAGHSAYHEDLVERVEVSSDKPAE
jgi:TolA-binding protein